MKLDKIIILTIFQLFLSSVIAETASFSKQLTLTGLVKTSQYSVSNLSPTATVNCSYDFYNNSKQLLGNLLDTIAPGGNRIYYLNNMSIIPNFAGYIIISSDQPIEATVLSEGKNPVPTINANGLTPNSATVGGAQFSLTMNGTNFVNGSIVRWNGNNRTTRYVNANQLAATIPVCDITTVGTYVVTAFNPVPGGDSSNPVNISLESMNNSLYLPLMVSRNRSEWNTFLGSSGQDGGYGITVDTSGNVYITGQSYATWGSPIRSFSGGSKDDAFVAKLNRNGVLEWNTFLGSPTITSGGLFSGDTGTRLAVDINGNVYISGISAGTWGSPIRPFSGGGGTDAFVAKLDSNGVLQWNTFLGSLNSGDEIGDYGTGIAVDSKGNVYITGTSPVSWGSPIYPFSGGGGTDAFVAKLDSNGVLQWNTFLGSSGNRDFATDLTVDSNGNAYITGWS
jgi:hypothetical protein